MIIFLSNVQKISYLTTILRHKRDLVDVTSCVKEYKNYRNILEKGWRRLPEVKYKPLKIFTQLSILHV